MAENKIVGYKKIFGFILPNWVDEGTIRLLVTFLLSTALMLLVLIFVVWPNFSTISDLKASLKKGQESLNSLLKSKQGYDQLNQEISSQDQFMVISAIPQTYSPETAIFLLRNLASQTPGLSIVSYKLPSGTLFDASSKPTDNNGNGAAGDVVSFVSYPIQLTVTAPVNSLLSFVDKIETALPFGVVSDLNMQEITKLAKSTSSNSVQMDLEVRYYQAVLKQIDITKIQPISTNDQALVQKLAGFSRPQAFEIGLNLTPVATGSGGSLFGF